EGLTEADIVRWHVQPGDQIAVNQIIVEIETAKAVVELPSPYAGTVASLLVPEGATADVGTPIISVEVGGGHGGSAPAQAVPAEAAVQRQIAQDEDLVPAPPVDIASEPGMIGSPAPKAERQAVLVGYGVKLGTTTRRQRKNAAAAPPAAAPAAGAGQQALANGAAAGHALAKPPVRKLARDLGVDLTVLAGSGPDGSITRDDVQQAAASGAVAERVPVPAAVVSAAGAREERIPIRGVRKHTAAAMAASAFTAPHVTEFLQIDITQTMAATARLRALPEFAEVRVSPLLLVAKALLVAAARHPMINSSWDEAAQEIVVKRYVNLGIAAATERGLIVPNIKEAQALSLPELARALAGLAETARAGKSTPADLSGGTITITNVGIFGVDTGTPILSPGEAAILAFGQVKDAPWVVDGALAVRKVCTLALSFDHRLVDGDLGSAVLRDVGAMLTDPLAMLAWS
ncbi:MAG TPA: dihydrolipoamide acetyltransferase family protein, partial [Streptosporangiaceae bacterium]|nr:dihydrolipoamide acetyltransferase family protein [Streptosporangiaceae bacterium]